MRVDQYSSNKAAVGGEGCRALLTNLIAMRGLPTALLLALSMVGALTLASLYLAAPAVAQAVPRTTALPGEIVITEVQVNPGLSGNSPSDSNGEWFEVHNTTSDRININGWIMTSGGSVTSHVIAEADGEVIIEPGDYFVIGRNANMAVNGGVVVDYDWTNSFSLNNSTDPLGLTLPDGTIIDDLVYTTSWPWSAGVAMQLHPGSDATQNDDRAFWCAAPNAPTGGDFGSPGEANPACPNPVSYTHLTLPTICSV